MYRVLIYLILFTSIFFNKKILYAQIDTSIISSDTSNYNEINPEEILLENYFEDTEDSKLLDDLDYLKRNPHDINTVTQQELETIPFINSFVAKNIIKFRKSKGFLKSKRELLKIDGINESLYELIKNYLAVSRSWLDTLENNSEYFSLNDKRTFELIKNTNIRYRARIQQDLQTKEGFLDGSYPGSRAKIFNQINFKNLKYKLEGNVTIEKDAGETSLTDFSSGFIKLKNYKFIKEVIIGDYTLTFGQGLGMWGSTGYSKGSLAVDVVKKRNRINGYSSVNESQFLRGAVTRLNFRNIDFTLFYSYNYFDASIDTTLNEISSFYFDGYHRTITEQNRQNSVGERLFGGRIYFNNNNIRFGTTYWTSKFSKIIGTDSTKQLYTFTGDKANMLSFDYDVIYKNVNLYGEFARSQSGTVAVLSAVQFNFSKIAELVFLYRNYPQDFSAVHSFGFGENNGNTQNENGFYTGLTVYPFKNLTINTYYDQFKFPYRTYLNPETTQGNDFLVNINWKANINLLLNFRYKNQNKEESQIITDEFGRNAEKIINRNQTNFRIGFNYKVSKKIVIRSRYDYVFIRYNLYGGNNKGSMFYTDLKFIPMQRLSASTRFAFFQTDNYDSRIYEYEEDIRGIMANIALYGKGRRWYVLLKYSPFNFFEIYGKYAETYLDGVTSIGTGNDLIKGNINNRLNIGMEILF
jgi:hypothetical protein